MRKLALEDKILLQVEKPARYIGNEVNSIMKEPAEVEIRYALCFPDAYEIGMSNLGTQILYDLYNKRGDVWCERVYSPWMDLHKIMKEKQIPLFALESQSPVKDMDFLGITIQYEMCYTNILQILDLSQIPLLAKDRTNEHPIVIGGGPCVYNPEPLADFFDLFYIGDGEAGYDEFFDLYKEYKQLGKNRRSFLEAVAKIPGYYVPSLYEVSYQEDGTIASFSPRIEGIPTTIEKQVVRDLSKIPYPVKPVVPFIKATQDRVVLEIQRGCIRGCRFCQAGMTYRPTRERSLAQLEEYAIELLKNTGHDEITLSSLSSSDYRYLPELVNFLIEKFKKRDALNQTSEEPNASREFPYPVNISLPSLRIDSFSLEVMGKVQDVKKSSLTFAPEAGSQRLRDVINKGLTEEDILNGAGSAFEGGWNKVKLYFMLGLPTETEEDMKEIPRLADKIARRYYEIPKEERNGKCQITMSTSFFIPKPHSPFQWASMFPKEEYIHRARVVNTEMKAQHNRKSLKYSWHEADVTVVEGAFARGDRRVGQVLLKAYEKGCLFDAWSEFFDDKVWMSAFEEAGVAVDFYTLREMDTSEILPWDFIRTGVSKTFLIREWERAKAGETTPNCREDCSFCGAMKYQCGVCVAA